MITNLAPHASHNKYKWYFTLLYQSILFSPGFFGHHAFAVKHGCQNFEEFISDAFQRLFHQTRLVMQS